MELNLTGRKVVITGAGDGIGRNLALAFAAEGARVGVCARSEDRLRSLELEIGGKENIFYSADLTKKEDLESFYKAIIDGLEGPDILINNVGGIIKLATFFDLTDEDWDNSFQLNLMPAVRLTRLFIETLRHSQAPRIINISSISAIRPNDIFPHYSAMKAAMSNLTASLAKTLAPENILVNSISPGPVWSQSWEKESAEVAKQSESNIQTVKVNIQTQTAETVPLKRMGVPEDLTGIALFLASDRASWITGSNFTVDGGIVGDTF
tara:strand:+ start:2103 stop:2900 length:798 start_codon:yes stop_codon:yes gene_type:complete